MTKEHFNVLYYLLCYIPRIIFCPFKKFLQCFVLFLHGDVHVLGRINYK